MRVCFYIDGFNLYHKIAELPNCRQKARLIKACAGWIYIGCPRNCASAAMSKLSLSIIFPLMPNGVLRTLKKGIKPMWLL